MSKEYDITVHNNLLVTKKDIEVKIYNGDTYTISFEDRNKKIPIPEKTKFVYLWVKEEDTAPDFPPRHLDIWTKGDTFTSSILDFKEIRLQLKKRKPSFPWRIFWAIFGPEDNVSVSEHEGL